MATVYNIKGSGNDKLPTNRSSWKDFWKVEMKQLARKTAWPSTCQSGSCAKPAKEGAHVSEKQNASFSNAGKIYIAPFCTDHNNENLTHGHTVANKYLCPR